MKISEMNTIQLAKFMSKALPSIKVIMKDGDIVNKLNHKEIEITKEMTKEEIEEANMTNGFALMFDIATMLMGEFPHEINKIVALAEEKTIKEIENQNGLATISSLVELLKDKEFINFIFSLLK